MTFTDLPTGWAQRPITDPDIFEDVIDLVVSEASRRSGATYLLVCGEQGRLQQPIALDGDFDDVPLECRHEVLTRLVSGLLELAPRLCLVVARARPGEPWVTDEDRAWHAEFVTVCREVGVPLRAAAIASPQGVCRFPEFADDLAQPA